MTPEIRILAKIIGKNPRDVTYHQDFHRLSTKNKQKYQNLLKKWQNGYPLDYILGEIKFLDLKFKINENVLVPRPETEFWVKELFLNEAPAVFSQTSPTSKPSRRGHRVFITKKFNKLVELGTGSGVIGLSLAKLRPNLANSFVLGDISEKALKVCNINKDNLGLGNNLELVKSDLLKGLVSNTPGVEKTNPTLRTDLWKRGLNDWVLIANLPYVPKTDLKQAKEFRVEYEPDLALYSGEDGLDLYRKLAKQVKTLKPKNRPQLMVFEYDPRQTRQIKTLFKLEKYKQTIISDENNLDRVLVCEKSS